MPRLTKEQLYSVIGLLVGLTVLSGFSYWVSPGSMKTKNWPTIITEVLFFVFIFFWNVVILAHGKSSKTLCLGSVLLLVASYTDVFDNFYQQPRWEDWGVQNLSLALGAGLFGLGLWYWDEEKERLMEQLQKDRDLDKAVVPKLSHDLRIPLRNVSDAARQLEQDPDIAADAKSRQALDTIHKAVREVNLQMENIVDAHWLKAGSAKLRPTIFGIAQLFNETSEEFRYQAEARSVTIVKQCAGGEISVMADRLKVRRIVQNLLDNAIKFCAPHGKVTLDASATAADVTVRVIDEGQGIAQEQMLDITQGSALTFGRGKDEDRESAGIGLSIVRDFVQLHGGRFWVESNSPTGAQFCIALPLTAAPRSQRA
ncbi:MAG: sensor histidine kinase [Candidatus Binatia bacterium]